MINHLIQFGCDGRAGGGRGQRGEFGAGSGACWVITDDLERIMLESMFRQELWIVSAPAGRMLGRDVFVFFSLFAVLNANTRCDFFPYASFLISGS